MNKTMTRVGMIVAGGLAGGFFALQGAFASLPARVAMAVLGGVCVGLGLYLHAKLQRS